MKASYINYSALIIAIGLIVFFALKGTDKKEIPADINNKEMPNDEIHKGMGGKDGVVPPSKENVSKQVTEQMNLMKTDLEKTPNDTSKMRIMADFLVAAHKSDEGIPYYEKILKQDPKRKDILFSLAFVYYNKQDWNKALDYTNRVLKLDKNDIQARYNLGAISASKGDTKTAMETWVKLIQDHPKGEISDMARQNLSKLK